MYDAGAPGGAYGGVGGRRPRSASSAGAAGAPPRAQPTEEFYGLGDFFKDLGDDLDRIAEKRKERTGRREATSLWEELADLGEEFVEFLEEGASEADKQAAVRREAARAEAEAVNEAASRARSSAKASAKNETEEVDDMLSALKKEMGL